MYDNFNTIQNHPWIPQQAFLYFPTGDSRKKQQDDYKIIINNQVKRLIYEGNIEYTQEENQMLEKFIKYLTINQFQITPKWSKAYIYKFFQSSGYDQKKSLRQMIAHNEYKKDLFSKDFQQLKKFAQTFLKKGPMYMNGRDAKYRLILVSDIAKIYSMKIPQNDLYMCLQYYFQFLHRNFFINGQVQNVIGIIDLGGISPFQLIKPMKMTINFLQGNYKYKLHAIYIIQSTSMFQMAYGIAKHLMKEDTIRKITIVEKGKVIEPLLKYTNPSQLEQRFGGTHPDLKEGQFWPPKFFSDDYSHPLVKNKIVSLEEYKNMYMRGQLPARKICLDFVKDAIREQSQSQCSSCSSFEQAQPIKSEIRLSQFMPEKVIIQSEKKKKSVFSRFLDKIGCHECCGRKRRKERRNSRIKDKN